jgi:hypothetical protein
LHFGRCIVEMFYLVEHVKEIEVWTVFEVVAVLRRNLYFVWWSDILFFWLNVQSCCFFPGLKSRWRLAKFQLIWKHVIDSCWRVCASSFTFAMLYLSVILVGSRFCYTSFDFLVL